MLTFEVPLTRVRQGKRVGFAETLPTPPPNQIAPMARTLAAAHRVVRAVESGDVRDFTEAALRMKVSQARISMMVALTFLAPSLQEALLLGQAPGLNSKQWLKVARIEAWKEQVELVNTLVRRESVSGGKSRIRNPEAFCAADSAPKGSQKGEIRGPKGGPEPTEADPESLGSRPAFRRSS